MLIKSEIGLWVVGPRRDSSTDWGCRQNGEPTPKHALNRRNSRKMTVAVQLTPTRSTTSLSTHYQNYPATSIKHEHMLR